MARTKQGDPNSYKSPDNINQIDWSRKVQFFTIFSYYQQLIRLRKEHPAFRMVNADQIRKHLHFSTDYQTGVVSYVITDHANGDQWKTILLVFNGNRNAVNLRIPETNKWRIVAKNTTINTESTEYFSGNEIEVQATSMLLFVED